jgi:hypothetical protein
LPTLSHFHSTHTVHSSLGLQAFKKYGTNFEANAKHFADFFDRRAAVDGHQLEDTENFLTSLQ